MLRISQFYRFAKKKEIIVNNFFNQSPIANYTSPNNKQIEEYVSTMKDHKNQWVNLQASKRQQILAKYFDELSAETSSQKMANLLSQCTGKQLQECKNETRVALKILKHHLTYPYVKIRYFQQTKGEALDYYKFQPFDNLLAVFDHRHPILSAVKYLGLALQSCNPLILRPSHNVLPVVDIFSTIWNNNSHIRMVNILVDAYLDPKHQQSPVKNILQTSEGFVSFDGRLKDGFDFHYYMTKNSIVMRQNQFLLTSSDSAYVMNNLNAEQLEKTVKIIARGSFSNCGHNFNSIKRVYVDKEIGQQFLSLLAAQSNKYRASSSDQFNEVNKSLLAPFIHAQEFKEALSQIKKIKQSHGDEVKHIIGGDELTIKVGEKDINFINPAIFQITSDFPNYKYQDQQFMLPICFVSFVDSSFDCIQKINSSIFGTTASIFTSDNRLQVIKPIGKKLDVGTVNVNTWEVTDGITYSGRKRSGKGFSYAPSSFNNIVRTKSVSYS